MYHYCCYLNKGFTLGDLRLAYPTQVAHKATTNYEIINEQLPSL